MLCSEQCETLSHVWASSHRLCLKAAASMVTSLPQPSCEFEVEDCNHPDL